MADWKYVETNMGDVAIMQCVVVPTGARIETEVTWRRLGGKWMTSEDNEVRVSSDGRLEINDAQLSDAGTYICSITVNGHVKSDNVTLTVRNRGTLALRVYRSQTSKNKQK